MNEGRGRRGEDEGFVFLTKKLKFFEGSDLVCPLEVRTLLTNHPFWLRTEWDPHVVKGC